MQQSTQTVPRSPRAKLSQRVRVRPHDSRAPEEICITRNVSRKGLYFETLQGHYFTGMYVHVIRNFHPDDIMSREEAGDVVRVERLKTGKWGVAVRFPDASSRPSRTPKPSGTMAVTKSFDTVGETEPAIAKRKPLEDAATNTIGKPDHRRTGRARFKIPLFVYGHTANEGPFFGEAFTIEINAHGALIAMKTAVPTGERLLLTNETNQKAQECTVLSVTTRQPCEVEVSIAFVGRATEFWRK